jgi:hypothetical protein
MREVKIKTSHKHEVHNKLNFMYKNKRMPYITMYIGKTVTMHNNKYGDS